MLVAAAAVFSAAVQTIYDSRAAGDGPASLKFGKRLKFAVSDVQSGCAAAA